jgi:GT2 family glycosyltransferase
MGMTSPAPASGAQHDHRGENGLLGIGVSAVVCTHARPLQLRRALQSLTDQSLPPAEVLVVDNAPPDESTWTLVKNEYPDVRYIREPRQGLNFARTRALHEATQEIVAFLDDDAVAHQDWTRSVRTAFVETPSAGVCTGRVEPLGLGTEGEQLFEENGGFSRGLERIRLPADSRRALHGRRAPLIAWAVSVGSGNNFAVRRHVALQLGGFDEALDMGAALPGGGDHDMLWRVLQAGYDVVYEPAALAWHEHRASRRGVTDQIIGHQRAVVAFLAKHVVRTGGRARLPLVTFLAWRLIKPGVRLIRRGLGRDPLPASALLLMWWNCWRGLSAYPAAKRLARRRREAAA